MEKNERFCDEGGLVISRGPFVIKRLFGSILIFSNFFVHLNYIATLGVKKN
jgi:hypothetical protein